MKSIPPFKSSHNPDIDKRTNIFYEEELNSFLRVKNELSRTNSPITSRTSSPIVSRTNSPIPELSTSRDDTKTRVFPDRYMYYDRKYYKTTLKTDYPAR